MLQKLKNRKADGFTIIEVLIVLAIAGLILLIVFLAVPALQRNAHNTSLKNDVAGLLGGVTEFANNNDGNLPDSVTNVQAKSVDLTNSTITSPNNAPVKLGYLDATSDLTVQKATGDVTNPGNVGKVDVYVGLVCNGPDGKTAGASSRNVVALYTLEGNAKVCQAS